MVTTRSNVSVGVNVAARSMVYVANEIARLFLDIVSQRGLPMDYLHEPLQTILDGLRTWIAGHWLTNAVLEIYDPASDQLIQCIDLGLCYATEMTANEHFETAIDQVRSTLGDDPVEPHLRYRVVAQLTDGAQISPAGKPPAYGIVGISPDHILMGSSTRLASRSTWTTGRSAGPDAGRSPEDVQASRNISHDQSEETMSSSMHQWGNTDPRHHG